MRFCVAFKKSFLTKQYLCDLELSLFTLCLSHAHVLSVSQTFFREPLKAPMALKLVKLTQVEKEDQEVGDHILVI